ncbi:MAG: methionine--tRNA ligase [Phycisphaerales bacterium]
MSNRPVYLTTPIYYVNDRPHIGHCYTTGVADVAARFQRLLGNEVYFLTGTDEHADKVIAKAVEHKMTEQQWVDQCAGEFKKAFELLGYSHDVFYRTSEEHHKTLAQKYITKLLEKGDIYLGDYVGWYDASQDEYLTETVAKESNYNSPVTGRPLEKRTEKNYFFRLSKYEQPLMDYVSSHPDFVMPSERRNEVIGRLKGGLQDTPVSRLIKPGESTWGVLMPNDPGHRVHVWIEALCNYLTAVDTPDKRRFWPATCHFMAKDIVWFHAVIWPAMLMALNEPLPQHVYAHAYWVREGVKMSKTLGNFVDIDVIRAYCNAFGRDAFRYYLVTQGPQNATDANFAHAKFVETFNAELSNGIGNCASRVGNMADLYFGGKVPDPKGVSKLIDGYDWPSLTAAAVQSASAKANAWDLIGATAEAIALVRAVDAYINTTKPFGLAKNSTPNPACATSSPPSSITAPRPCASPHSSSHPPCPTRWPSSGGRGPARPPPASR